MTEKLMAQPVVAGKVVQATVIMPDARLGGQQFGVPPVGTWSHGLCDCMNNCTPCLIAWCCPCVTFGHIAGRLGYRPAGDCCDTPCKQVGYTMCGVALCQQMAVWGTFFTMLALVFYGVSAAQSAQAVEGNSPEYEDGQMQMLIVFFASIFNGVLRLVTQICYIVLIAFMFQLRNKLRERFQIPGGCCESQYSPGSCAGYIDDCLCTLYCSICSRMQMAQHVMQYEANPQFAGCDLTLDPPPMGAVDGMQRV